VQAITADLHEDELDVDLGGFGQYAQAARVGGTL
jgi:hypothetical protein